MDDKHKALLKIVIQVIGNFHHNKPSCVYTSISICRPIVRLGCSQEHSAGSLVISESMQMFGDDFNNRRRDSYTIDNFMTVGREQN